LAASVLVTVDATFVSVDELSVPEFTLKFEAHPHYVPATYVTDKYTGKQVIDEEGYYVKNKSVVFTVKNEVSSSTFNSTYYQMFYNVRVKGHFEDEWHELYPIFDGWKSYSNSEFQTQTYVSKNCPQASKSEYTVFSVPVDKYPVDAQLDFQVQAIVGHDSQIFLSEDFFFPRYSGWTEPAFAFDTAGYWSKTQTINLGLATAFAFILAGALILIPVATGLGLIIYFRKRKTPN
jgi:hypothetical protein